MRLLPAPLALLLAAAAPPPGTVSVEAATGDTSPAAARIFAEAVGGALAQAGFLPLPPPGRGRYRAELRLVREPRGLVTSAEPRWRPSGSVGGWGAALAVQLPSKKTALRQLNATTLEVRLIPRAGGAPVWQGRALTLQVEDTRADSPAALASKLAQAVVGRFPAQSDELIAIP